MKSKSFMRQQPHHLDQSTPLRGADPTAEDGDTAPEKCRRRLSHRLLGSLHVGFVPLLEKQGTRQNNPPSIDRGSFFFFRCVFRRRRQDTPAKVKATSAPFVYYVVFTLLGLAVG